MLAFGPVPSRRLGFSLGVNNIRPKTCTYACVYCQLGVARVVPAVPAVFFSADEIQAAVIEKIEKVRNANTSIDYLTFVPSGEPTLDIHLQHAIERLKPLGLKTAVITNASMLWQPQVRSALAQVGWVSLKVDAVTPHLWRRINRPHKDLKLPSILDGMLEFAAHFKGKLVTETMLVRNLNDTAVHMDRIAKYLKRLNPTMAYLSIPTRPPAETWVRPPGEDTINQAYQVFHRQLHRVEYLIVAEGDSFGFTGNLTHDLLSITAVHPIREDALRAYLRKVGADWSDVQVMIDGGQIVGLEYEGQNFFMRNLGLRHRPKFGRHKLD